LWGVRTPVLLLTLMFPRRLAQDPAPPAIRFDGKVIARVDFEPPDQPLPRDELDRLIPLRSGLPLNAEDVRIAIQKLYSTGRFTNVVGGRAAGRCRRVTPDYHRARLVRGGG
jgi:outer membrane protein assembly factor BamA